MNDSAIGLDWDAALIVINALRKSGTKATATQLHDDIEHLSNFPGISGTYDFTDGSQRGVGVKDLMVLRYDPTSINWLRASNFGGSTKR